MNEALAIKVTRWQHTSRKFFITFRFSPPPFFSDFDFRPKKSFSFFFFDQRIFTKGNLDFNARSFNRGRWSTFSRVVEERTTSRGRERRACEGVVSFNPQLELYTFVSRVPRETPVIPSSQVVEGASTFSSYYCYWIADFWSEFFDCIEIINFFFFFCEILETKSIHARNIRWKWNSHFPFLVAISQKFILI